MPSEVACRMSRIDHHYEVEPLNDTQRRGHSINLSLTPCPSCLAASVISPAIICHQICSQTHLHCIASNKAVQSPETLQRTQLQRNNDQQCRSLGRLLIPALPPANNRTTRTTPTPTGRDVNPAVLCATASFLAHLRLHLHLHLDLSLVRPFVPSSRSRSRYAPPWPWSPSSLTPLSLTCPHLQPQTDPYCRRSLPCCIVPARPARTNSP